MPFGPSKIRGGSTAVSRWAKQICPVGVEHQFHEYSVEERDRVTQKPRLKRQFDFETGRSCAHSLLESMGEYQKIGQRKDRAPLWPNGFVGSISHSERVAWAAVSNRPQLRSIGVDTEAIVDDFSRRQLLFEIGSSEEWGRMGQANRNPEVAFTILFSAKESFYKACSAVTGAFFGFQHAEVIEASPEMLTLAMTSQNPNQGKLPPSLDVYFFVDRDAVYTVTWMTTENKKIQT